MKKKISYLLIIGLFMIGPLLLLGQNPPHPNGGNDPGSENTPVGGGAPIGGGSMIIMLMLGISYAGKKTYNTQMKINGLQNKI